MTGNCWKVTAVHELLITGQYDCDTCNILVSHSNMQLTSAFCITQSLCLICLKSYF